MDGLGGRHRASAGRGAGELQPCPLGPLISPSGHIASELYRGTVLVMWTDEGAKCQEVFVRLDRANHRLYWDGAGCTNQLDIAQLKVRRTHV